jgi:hypothetical protein
MKQLKRKFGKVTSLHFGEAAVNEFYIPTVRYPGEELCTSLFKRKLIVWEQFIDSVVHTTIL